MILYEIEGYKPCRTRFQTFIKPKRGNKTMSEILVVRSKIKDAAKGMNVAGDFADALSERVSVLVNDACRRAKDNGRATVKARDL
tara:strand:- start:338 stop:592 length:255 start_codon:yes stop_codon:yes gene_type:complete